MIWIMSSKSMFGFYFPPLESPGEFHEITLKVTPEIGSM